MRCGECGSKNLAKQSAMGRAFRWKDFAAVTVTQPLDLMTCQQCGNAIAESGDGQRMDAVIEASISEQVRAAILQIKRTHVCEQKEIARRLGVTPERLSEVKSGRSMPSYQLFNFLKTMAVDFEAFKAASPEVYVKIELQTAGSTRR